ncbi:MAG: DUF1611 domain-containing protein [Acidobacteria bacterium]|nr:DUF1611 domain-containing protein [Acidobacteriota bacterium]
MRPDIEGVALVYCEGAFNTPNGKTAHGLVRFTERYRVAAVVDSRHAGQDAGQVLDGRPKDIPIYAAVMTALTECARRRLPCSHLVVGLAPDGGRLSVTAREDVKTALAAGLNIDSGLHDFLGEDEELCRLAEQKGLQIRDIRKPPPRGELHFFSGKIEQVDCLKIALLGTDSAVGKRTTAWQLVHALRRVGYPTEMVGTGQTAWLQGARYGLVLDSLINDFVAGEIEHAVWSAWREAAPAAIVIEGQGSLMNPAYPGGFEILAAGRPDMIILQHAPARREYDGFPGYTMHPLGKQIEALQMVSGKPVVAITINHEDIAPSDVPLICRALKLVTGLPAYDVLLEGADALARTVLGHRPPTEAGGTRKN